MGKCRYELAEKIRNKLLEIYLVNGESLVNPEERKQRLQREIFAVEKGNDLNDLLPVVKKVLNSKH